MTFLTKEKDFNLLYFLSPGARGARQEPPPRGGPGGSAFSAGLGGLLDGPMGPPGVSPTLPSNASRNSILKILVSTSIENVLELCMFNFYKVSPDFVAIWACISVTDHPAVVVVVVALLLNQDPPHDCPPRQVLVLPSQGPGREQSLWDGSRGPHT